MRPFPTCADCGCRVTERELYCRPCFATRRNGLPEAPRPPTVARKLKPLWSVRQCSTKGCEAPPTETGRCVGHEALWRRQREGVRV